VLEIEISLSRFWRWWKFSLGAALDVNVSVAVSAVEMVISVVADAVEVSASVFVELVEVSVSVVHGVVVAVSVVDVGFDVLKSSMRKIKKVHVSSLVAVDVVEVSGSVVYKCRISRSSRGEVSISVVEDVVRLSNDVDV